jgi:NADPH-dependent 2,4-dienoyl-CoA reductase/sulfur reductase-like enzyme/ferredoxin
VKPNDRLFRNYTQLDSYLSVQTWQRLRYLSILATLGVFLLLLFRPELGLALFWNFLVILLPAVFFTMPGLWRNLCPLAATNQLPRLFNLTRGWTLSESWKANAYVVGMALFFVLVTCRKIFFNTSGPATAALLGGALLAALVGGFLFKGKSGWCSTFCPLLPVQRLYGQNPQVMIANSHCQPCVGCAKNCFDFNPTMAPLADQYDDDRHYVGFRRLFAALFPGFILAYFVVPGCPVIDLSTLLFQTGLYMAASLTVFHLLDHAFRGSLNRIVAVYAAVSLALYYWFASVQLMESLTTFGLPAPEAGVWVIRALVIALGLAWIRRTWRNEKQFLRQINGEITTVNVQVGGAAEAALGENAARRAASLLVNPEGRKLATKPKQTVLEAVEACGLKLESGCRMGVCGADPVAVTEGMDSLSPATGDEKSTLERLGFAKNTRMACCARIQGAVTVELKPHPRGPSDKAAPVKFDPALKRVVIIGTGIAGITSADHVRRRHPECEIHLVGREPHLLYNRMGISRLIYGQSGMQGLYLMPESWYAEHRITLWINTSATRIDATARGIELATGDRLPYDKLILANGSSCVVPPLEGFGAKGTCVLREADEAIAIRKYVQENGVKNAVIAGAGLLGLEAAYALKKMGVSPTVLSNSARILNRQLDGASASLLGKYLHGLGIHILTLSQAARLETRNGAVTAVHLQDGNVLPCELFMACVGVRPNLDLAREAGLAVKNGVVVDEAMRTSDPHIYAAGDVAEYRGELWGLWPVAVEQAEIAAANATGETRSYAGFVPSTLLKVVGADVMSVGVFEEVPGDEVLLDSRPAEYKYRKLIVRDGKLAGAVLIGHPTETALLTRIVKAKTDVSDLLPQLRAGDLSSLENR